MIRNQIYFTEDQDRELRLMVATGQGVYSQLVRKAVDLLIKKGKKKKDNDWDAWKSFVGAIKGGSKTDGVKAIQDYYKNDVA